MIQSMRISLNTLYTEKIIELFDNNNITLFIYDKPFRLVIMSIHHIN